MQLLKIICRNVEFICLLNYVGLRVCRLGTVEQMSEGMVVMVTDASGPPHATSKCCLHFNHLNLT